VKVLVAETLAEDGLALLRAEHEVDYAPGLPRPELLDRLAEADALIVRSQVRVDAEALAAGRRLVVVGRAGTGVDNIDLDAATRAGVTVVNAPAANTIAAAEHTLALIYGLARHVPAADASLRAGEWRRTDFVGRELRGRTLGIVGLGRIGLTVAARARAMEMDLLGHDPFVSAELAAQHGIALVSLAELLPRSDVVTVHVPLTHATRGLIGAAELAQVKPGALLINVARGGVVDEEALADALAGGRLGGAAVDVFDTEPPAADNPLRSAPNTVLTPHLGASTTEAQARAATDTVAQVLDVLAGRPARYAVNAPLLPPETAGAIAPYLPLARAIGQFYAQFARRSDDLTLELAGDVAAYDSRLIAAAVLTGLLEAAGEERVNAVNAELLAAQRGLRLATRQTPDSERHPSLLSLSGTTRVAGTVSGEPRIVGLADYWVDLPLARWMLVTRHQDRPATMGRIGLMLGEADVNISGMHLGRSAPRADALMILALDDPVPEDVLERIRRHEAVLDLWLISLPAVGS